MNENAVTAVSSTQRKGRLAVNPGTVWACVSQDWGRGAAVKRWGGFKVLLRVTRVRARQEAAKAGYSEVWRIGCVHSVALSPTVPQLCPNSADRGRGS